MKPSIPKPRVLPAVRGLGWVSVALMLLRAQPLRMLLLGLVLQLLAGLMQLGPLGVLFVLSVPALSAGMMLAWHTVASGSIPQLSMLFRAFTQPDRLLRLVLLGALVLGVAMVSVMFSLSGLIAGLDAQTLQELEQGQIERLFLEHPEELQRSLLAMMLALAVSGTISYFAVPLIWFMDLRLWRAVLIGLRGLLLNWRAFLLMGVMLALLALPVVIMYTLVSTLNATGSPLAALGGTLMMFLVALYQLVVLATQYVAFAEVFGLASDNSSGGIDNDRDGQLVA